MTDDDLWRAFHSRSLPAALWTHEAHLRIAWMHLRRHPLDDAHILMRVGIILLNASHGLIETPARGYHETITRGFLVIIEGLVRGDAAQDSRVFLERHAAALAKDALLGHYSRPLLESPLARAVFVEPDLSPLPGRG